MRIFKMSLMFALLIILCACGKNSEKKPAEVALNTPVPRSTATMAASIPTVDEQYTATPTVAETMKEQFTVAPGGVPVTEVNKTLGIDLLQLLHETDPNIVGDGTIYNIDLKKCSFCGPRNKKEDYLLSVAYNRELGNDYSYPSVTYWFAKTGNHFTKKYEVLSTKLEWTSNNEVDIDMDGKSEFVLQTEQKYFSTVKIIRYDGSIFQSIFEQDLINANPQGLCSYENEMKFVKNKSRHLDILFTVHTRINMDLYKQNKSKYPDESIMKETELPKPVNQEVLFTFDGTIYKPNKIVNDYNRFVKDGLLK